MKMACPHCSQHIETDDTFAGMTATCPTCNGDFTLLPKLPASTQSTQPSAIAPIFKKNYANTKNVRIVAFCCSIALVLGLVLFLAYGHSSGKVSSIVSQPSLSKDDVRSMFQTYFNGNIEVKDEQTFPHTVYCAQYWFDLIHPVGKAKNVDIDDVVLNKNANGNIESVGVQAVLYWDGPLQSGSTTFKVLYDTAGNQFRNLSIVCSDGITRSDVDNFANGFVIGAQIGEAISSK